MKQSPDLAHIQKQMQPGVITPCGFLGSDRRTLAEILQSDDAIVGKLGLTHEKIGEKMRYFRQQALSFPGEGVECDGHFLSLIEDARGGFPCPFGHKGMVDKSVITVRNLKKGTKIVFSDMQIHLIEHHGFYQGKGSQFRLEPEHLAEILEVK